MTPGTTISVLDKGYVRFVDVLGTDRRIVEAARVSYGGAIRSEAEDKRLLFYLYRNRHTSPFEMCKVTLDFKMPIFVARQYVRHRMQSMNEFSMRYKEAPEEFYIPGAWRIQDQINKQSSSEYDVTSPWHLGLSAKLKDHCQRSYKLYEDLIADGVAREMARMVLPLNIYTYFYATWDLKNLLHFITLRDDSHAQAEIQEYGKAIKSILSALFPWTMEAYNRFKFPCTDNEASS